MYFSWCKDIRNNKGFGKFLVILPILSFSATKLEAMEEQGYSRSDIKQQEKLLRRYTKAHKAKRANTDTSRVEKYSSSDIEQQVMLLSLYEEKHKAKQGTTDDSLAIEYSSSDIKLQEKLLRKYEKSHQDRLGTSDNLLAEKYSSLGSKQEERSLYRDNKTPRAEQSYRSTEEEIAHAELLSSNFEEFNDDTFYPSFAKFKVERPKLVAADPSNPKAIWATSEEYTYIDAGYDPSPDNPYRNTARSRIYGSYIPNAPAIHRYDLLKQNVYDSSLLPYYIINIRAPYTSGFAPKSASRHLNDIESSNIDAFVMGLYIPQQKSARLKESAELPLLRAHYWLEPNAPHHYGTAYSLDKKDFYSHAYEIKAGIFSTQLGGPRLKGQSQNGLLSGKVIIHNGCEQEAIKRNDMLLDPILICSPNNFAIENLDEQTRVFYSVVKWQNKAAVVRYISLCPEDRDTVEAMARSARNLHELKDLVSTDVLTKPVGRYFDPYERD